MIEVYDAVIFTMEEFLLPGLAAKHIAAVIAPAIDLLATKNMELSEDLCRRVIAAALCDKPEQNVLPCFYRERERFIKIMRQAIALNGGFLNTQRMMAQYLHNAYRLVGEYVRRG
ncbi:MAG: hypothetical protein ACT4PN_05330 [Nitrospiraceae bacterium]